MEQFILDLKDLQGLLKSNSPKPFIQQMLKDFYPNILKSHRPNKYKDNLVINYYLSLIKVKDQQKVRPYLSSFLNELRNCNIKNSLDNLIVELQKLK